MILLTVPLAVAGIVAGRLLLGRIASRLQAQGITARRILLCGDRALAAELRSRLDAMPGRRYEVVGTVADDSPLLAGDGFAARRLSELCHRERVHELVFADRGGALAEVAAGVRPLLGGGIRLRLLGPWVEAWPEGVRLDELGGLPLLSPVGRGGLPDRDRGADHDRELERTPEPNRAREGAH